METYIGTSPQNPDVGQSWAPFWDQGAAGTVLLHRLQDPKVQVIGKGECLHGALPVKSPPSPGSLKDGILTVFRRDVGVLVQCLENPGRAQVVYRMERSLFFSETWIFWCIAGK